ncbi:LLM class flavin-dependent oxidoreductase [Actinopolymorpha sp. B17G11]|uniref:LLM class flavin-dependent oxidoreductase n=1 Tax=Actinopolymorpha sp. B17G11 TaxID=3160861 RepID=UPI0032E3920C
MSVPTFGILHDFRQPLPHRQTTAAYLAECLEEVAEADRLGFDAVWMSEHHLTPDGLLPSPLVMAGAIAARTTKIQIGTNILVLPLHHPLRVAEDAAVVDLISGGRLVLGVGQGYAEREFAAFGVNRRFRPSLLEEGLEVVRQALTDGRVRMRGRRWSIDDVPITPSPRRPVPILVGGVSQQALARAAHLGDGVLLYCATPRDLRARCRVLDRVLGESDPTSSPDGTRRGARRRLARVCTGILHVAEDAEQAWAEAGAGIAYMERSIASYSTPDAGTDLWSTTSLDPSDYLVGTPEQVADRLVDLHAETGFDHFAHWVRLPGISHTRAMESLHLINSRLLPAVRERITRRQASTGRVPPPTTPTRRPPGSAP